MPPPRLIEITPSPTVLGAVARYRWDRRDPDEAARLDLADSLWLEPLVFDDRGLVATVAKELLVQPYAAPVLQKLRSGTRDDAEHFAAEGSIHLENREVDGASSVPTDAALADLVARDLRGQELRPFVDVLDACEWLCLGARRAIVSLHPGVRQLDARGRFHASDGPAVRWIDGTELWCWHGVEVGRRAIEAPESLLLGDVQLANGPAARRALIERYGLGRYLLDVGAPSLARDEAGELYRLEQSGEEPLVAVRVVDRVLDVAGVAKEHWIRVPPHLRSARAAVAWTFGVEPRKYRPQEET